jgi:hypothetical protein
LCLCSVKINENPSCSCKSCKLITKPLWGFDKPDRESSDRVLWNLPAPKSIKLWGEITRLDIKEHVLKFSTRDKNHKKFCIFFISSLCLCQGNFNAVGKEFIICCQKSVQESCTRLDKMLSYIEKYWCRNGSVDCVPNKLTLLDVLAFNSTFMEKFCAWWWVIGAFRWVVGRDNLVRFIMPLEAIQANIATQRARVFHDITFIKRPSWFSLLWYFSWGCNSGC